MSVSSKPKIVVIGLGYVGLPLAVALARHFETIGLDIDARRIAELESDHDRTGEIDGNVLATSRLRYAARAGDCPPADIYIVTVPTPVDGDNAPDLSLVRKASQTVGAMLDAARKPIVVFESTVYPGVTEDICGPILEQASGLKRGSDFFVGYSPERINPGDREHTVDRITKVIAGENLEVTARLAELYGAVTSGGTFAATSIKVAEAAKVIENAQRDINIAFMNEIARIFARMDISVWDVLAAAGTKWNFLQFKPGLVGGHCIGVDPYYLSKRAVELGYEPAVILAGRAINDAMAPWIASEINKRVVRQADILVLGLAFKENIPDLRNSKVADLIAGLRQAGHAVTVHDPLVDAEEAEHEYGIVLEPLALSRNYDAVILAVAHAAYDFADGEVATALIRKGGLFADIKGIYPDLARRNDVTYWGL